MNLTETRAVLGILGLAYDRQLPEAVAEVWAAVLTDVPLGDAQAAALELVKTNPHLPRVADLRDRARLIRQQRDRDTNRRRQLDARHTPAPTPGRTGAAMVRHVLGRLADAGQDVSTGRLLGRDRASAVAHTAIEEWLERPLNTPPHRPPLSHTVACTTCYTPTTNPTRECDRCLSEDDPR